MTDDEERMKKLLDDIADFRRQCERFEQWLDDVSTVDADGNRQFDPAKLKTAPPIPDFPSLDDDPYEDEDDDEPEESPT